MLSSARNYIKELRRDLALKQLPSIADFPTASFDRPLAHVAAFQLSNAGDVLLPITLKDVFHTDIGQLRWENLHVHNTVRDRAVERINASGGLLIGGGGLFLRDTNPNQLSGWQWSCSLENLRRIDVPIATYAVGYNRFRGQPDFDPIFTDHVNELAERAVYLGLRNTGSIDAMRSYLTVENQKKLRFQPCMTTVISRLYPSLCDWNEGDGSVAFNAAFDRPKLRFGAEPAEKLKTLARAMKRVSQHAPIRYFAHMKADEQMCPYLDDAGVSYDLVRLDYMTPTEIIRTYNRPSLVIGMRGHAQMIPFGTETPILSLITHDKLRFFLDDLGRNEWGVDMNDGVFEEHLVSLTLELLDSGESVRSAIREVAEPLWTACRENAREFLEAAGA